MAKNPPHQSVALVCNVTLPEFSILIQAANPGLTFRRIGRTLRFNQNRRATKRPTGRDRARPGGTVLFFIPVGHLLPVARS